MESIAKANSKSDKYELIHLCNITSLLKSNNWKTKALLLKKKYVSIPKKIKNTESKNHLFL